MPLTFMLGRGSPALKERPAVPSKIIPFLTFSHWLRTSCKWLNSMSIVCTFSLESPTRWWDTVTVRTSSTSAQPLARLLSATTSAQITTRKLSTSWVALLYTSPVYSFCICLFVFVCICLFLFLFVFVCICLFVFGCLYMFACICLY